MVIIEIVVVVTIIVTVTMITFYTVLVVLIPVEIFRIGYLHDIFLSDERIIIIWFTLLQPLCIRIYNQYRHINDT